MGAVRIAYIADYGTPDIAESRNLASYSLAGSKIEGIVKCIERAGMNVTIISSACNNNTSLRFHRLEKGKLSRSDVIYLPFISVPYLNFISSILLAIIYLSFMVSRGQLNRILFYNHSPKVIIPAILMKLMFNVPIYLEYEDSYYRGAKNPVKRTYGFCVETIISKIVDGAILVNSLLVNEVKTRNVMICRGFTRKFTYTRSRALYDREIWIGYTGRLDSIRGIDRFVNAVLSIPEEINGKKIKVFITGEGPLKEWMLNRIEKAHNVKYLGVLDRDRYERLIVNIDILVNPHTERSRDLFPSKILEYMSTGNIVISSNCSDISLISYKNLSVYTNDTLGSLLNRIVKEQPRPVKDTETVSEYGVMKTYTKIKEIFDI